MFPRFSAWNRRRKAKLVRRFVEERDVRSVLLVGVGEGWSAWTYIVEEAAARDGARVVSCDLHAQSRAPWPYARADGLALPFRDSSFDLVLSNAVIEHVGGEAEQRQFVREHTRVGKHWIITTPNRLFPIESHTWNLCLHWSGSWRAQHGTAFFTKLLSKTEFRRLLAAQWPNPWPLVQPHVHGCFGHSENGRLSAVARAAY